MNVIAWLSQYPDGFDWYAWVILPLLVFFARVVDVTLGTMRIIFVSRGKKYLAPLLGFLGFDSHVETLSRGVADTRDLIYFASLSGFFLHLAYLQVNLRRVRP